MSAFRGPLAFASALALGLAAPTVAGAEPDAAGKVAIDRATGRLRAPSAEELKVLGDALRRLVREDTAGLRPVVHSDGTVGLVLEDRFQTVTVAEMGADGAVSSECLTSAAEAEAWLARAAGDGAAQASAPAALEDR